MQSDPHAYWAADEISNRLEGAEVIDVGCLDGLFTVFYALNHPEMKFAGIDLSGEALKAARQRAAAYNVENVEWLEGDVLGPQMETTLQTAGTIILKDVLANIFGLKVSDKQTLAQRTFYPHLQKRSFLVIANEILKGASTNTEGYLQEHHKEQTLHVEPNIGDITYNVDFLRKL